MAINVQEIVDSFGRYYEKGGQNLSRLIRQLTQASETLAVPGTKHLKVEETIYRTANVTSTEVVQAYQHQFTPKGDAKFVPNTIVLHNMKCDVVLAPDMVEDNWLGFMASENQDPKTWPIVRYMLEEILAKQIEADRELKLVYSGSAADPTEGTAGAAVGAMDGLKALLKAGTARTAYPIHKVESIGALTKGDIFDQVEAFEDAIPGNLKSRRMVFYMAPEMAMAYFRKLRALGFYDVTSEKGLSMTIDRTKHEIVGVASMTGTTDLFATMPENILHLTKRDRNAAQFDMQKQDRDVKILGSWWEGLGFADNDLVWTTAETVA